jgi:hypothetical protein
MSSLNNRKFRVCMPGPDRSTTARCVVTTPGLPPWACTCMGATADVVEQHRSETIMRFVERAFACRTKWHRMADYSSSALHPVKADCALVDTSCM